MDANQIKGLLERIQIELKDESLKNEAKELIKELEKGSLTSTDPAKIPKPVLKRVVDLVSKFVIKLAKYEVMRWIAEQIGDVDLGP